jgi:hypothetical protein
MSRWAFSAGLTGFVVGFFWLAMSFVFFTAEPQGPWWTLYFILMLITCPAWFLAFFFPLVPLVNGAIYALAALFIFKLRESSRCISQHDTAPESFPLASPSNKIKL